MARWSNNITVCINVITFLIGLFLLGFGGYLASHNHLICSHLLNMPCLRIGSLLVFISSLGLLGSCFRSSFLLWLYLFLYLILILMVTIGVLLWIVVMSKGTVRLDVGEARKLNDFTFWFQDQVTGLAEWSKVRKCLIHKNVCSSQPHEMSFLFSKNIQDGCCHRPRLCSENFLTVHDCDVWRNETEKMCYYCSSCAQGFVSQLAVLWRRLFPGIVALLVILIAIFILGCHAFRQNKTDHYKKLYKSTKP